MCKEKKDISG